MNTNANLSFSPTHLVGVLRLDLPGAAGGRGGGATQSAAGRRGGRWGGGRRWAGRRRGRGGGRGGWGGATRSRKRRGRLLLPLVDLGVVKVLLAAGTAFVVAAAPETTNRRQVNERSTHF